MFVRQNNSLVFIFRSHCAVFAILLIASFGYTAESVREMMEKEVGSVSSLQSFYETHTKPYERRYIIQYAPEYLTKFSASETPGWLIKALEDAVNSKNQPLVIAAIKCIGVLKLEQFSENVTALFTDAYQKNTAYAIAKRIAVLDAMKNFSENTINEKIPELVKSYSELLIGDPVFEKLMESVVLFSDASLVTELSRFEVQAQKGVEENKDKPERQQEYARIAQMISRTKNSISKKGGK